MKGRIRIIAGGWRGRTVAVGAAPEVRPTPDRVRETLFNWIAPRLAGARCLDLFAGTGVLGLEAASRGAAEVVLVERAPALVKSLDEALARLGTGGPDGGCRFSVVCEEALSWLDRQPAHGSVDVAFLDPPFGSGLLAPACAALAAGRLTPGARVYLESELDADALPLPPDWALLRCGRAGQVRYYLAAPGAVARGAAGDRGPRRTSGTGSGRGRGGTST